MHTPGTSSWGYFKGKLPALGAPSSLLPFLCPPIPLGPSGGPSSPIPVPKGAWNTGHPLMGDERRQNRDRFQAGDA